jgi:malate dehydrogenase (oxaloacetate-decarboxylating)
MATKTATARQKVQKVRTKLTGSDLLSDPRLNKGTAFTEVERDVFALHGLLPPHIGTLDEQVERRQRALRNQPTPFAKYALLRDLQDADETLFYALITRNIRETLPIVYTPTVGEGCQRFSEIWHKPRGLFVSYPNKDRIEQILSHSRFDEIKCIVVSDGERILGLGDQGIGGMGIPIGKIALYTALAGIPPENCLPILVDVGTENEERLRDPLYMGWRHRRIRGPQYDEFLDIFISAVKRRWSHVLLQWEDFAAFNALCLLDRYREKLCSFNDDIQGTGAVAAATLLSAMNVTGIPLKEQRIAIVGLGSAGLGIGKVLVSLLQDEGLSEREAYGRFYGVDLHGLLVEGVQGIRAEQQPFMRKRSELETWQVSGKAEISLSDVVRNAKLTILIGVCGHASTFSEDAVRMMAKNTARPIILPLSNPTSQCEATPQGLLDWTEGRALIGTGSPFEPVLVNGKPVRIAQTNNSYIFPGLALGIIASRAKRVSDAMIKAAAKALAELSPARKDKEGCLLPPLENIRSVSKTIARAVGAQAINDGLGGIEPERLEAELEANIWEPAYKPYELGWE